jgi:hypothetical protein
MSICNGETIYNKKSIYEQNTICSPLYKEGGGSSQRAIFLTKFDVFDNSLHQDTPDIGDPYIFDPAVQYVRQIDVDFLGRTIKAIHDEWIVGSSAGFKKNIEYKKMSFEGWFYLGGNSDSYGLTFQIGPKYIYADPLYSGSFEIFGPLLDNVSYTLYNGTTVGDYNFAKFGVRPRKEWFFYSCVFDEENKEIRFYINGDIMLKIISNVPYPEWGFLLEQQNSGKYTDVAYAAAFEGDKSINNGLNYPITNI